MKAHEALAKQSINKLLWQFSWPAIVGMLCIALYSVVDRIFVGRGVGSLAIAATTVAFPLMVVLLALSLLIGVGATALISIRLGEGRKESAEIIMGNAVTMLVLLPLLFSLVYFGFSEEILQLCGASSDVLPYARDFVHIIMLGSVAGSLSMGMNNFIRAEGNPLRAMSTQILGAIINGILNYIFIFHMGMGIKGSALATVLGQLLSTLWICSYYWTGKSLLKFRLQNFRPQLPILMSITAIGFAPFAMQLASCMQMLILNKTIMAYSGDLALSAVGIMMSIAPLVFMPILGISQGAQPIIGYNYGARKLDRVKAAFKKAVIAGSSVSLAGFLVIMLFPEVIAGMFSSGDVILTRMTSEAMTVFFSMFFVIGFQIVGSQYFQAVGKPGQAAVLSLSRQVLLFIPLLVILPVFWGIDGVWRSAPIADGLSVLITAGFVMNEMKRLPNAPPSPAHSDKPEPVNVTMEPSNNPV